MVPKIEMRSRILDDSESHRVCYAAADPARRPPGRPGGTPSGSMLRDSLMGTLIPKPLNPNP
jgi:hypothetical protein